MSESERERKNFSLMFDAYSFSPSVGVKAQNVHFKLESLISGLPGISSSTFRNNETFLVGFTPQILETKLLEKKNFIKSSDEYNYSTSFTLMHLTPRLNSYNVSEIHRARLWLLFASHDELRFLI